MPLDKPPPRETRFGSPLELSRVHWVRPEVVVEMTYLTWTRPASCGRSRIRGSGRTSRQNRSFGRLPFGDSANAHAPGERGGSVLGAWARCGGVAAAELRTRST